MDSIISSYNTYTTMKTVATHSSTTKVNFYHSTRYHITKHSIPQVYGYKTVRNWLNAKAENIPKYVTGAAPCNTHYFH